MWGSISFGEFLDNTFSSYKINFKLILTVVGMFITLWSTYKQSRRFGNKDEEKYTSYMYFIYFYVSRLLCSFAIYSNSKRVFG